MIFGGTGDLTRRKLLPALAGLAGRRLVPGGTSVLALGRSRLTEEEYRAMMRQPLGDAGADTVETMSSCEVSLHYQPLGEGTPEDYRALAERIRSLEAEHGLAGDRIFYLALPPASFAPTVEALGEAGLNHGPGWTRLVVEKPFGTDLASADELNRRLHRYFGEEQIYRIDHYLGKETVQNLLVFRFANPIFESLWNRNHVERVQITVAETVGAGQRAGYYDRSGALRDMVQNHLTQLLTLTAMEVPATFDADSIRAEKAKVLRSVSPISDEDVVWAQYAAGEIQGQPVPGYREEPAVPDESVTETFVALRLEVANWRWQGVPFLLRTGKRLPQRVTDIRVVFRRAPVALFRRSATGHVHRNVLTLSLQPNEGFDLAFEVKTPGGGVEFATQHLRFGYAEAFGEIPDAYETLLLDVMTGDQTLFVHAEEVEAAWRLYTPLLERRPAPLLYPAGTWGPDGAGSLFGSHAPA